MATLLERERQPHILDKQSSLDVLHDARMGGKLEPAQAYMAEQLVMYGVAFDMASDEGGRFTVLDVVDFMNHQVNTREMNRWGAYLAYKMEYLSPTKLLTVKAGGISVTHVVASELGNIPYVFASKGTTLMYSSEESYVAENRSYTQAKAIPLVVARRCLQQGDRVVFVDDFLDQGDTTLGIADICEQAGAQLVGAAYLINKAAAGGEQRLRNEGIDVPVFSVLKLKGLVAGGMQIEGITDWLYVSSKAGNGDII